MKWIKAGAIIFLFPFQHLLFAQSDTIPKKISWVEKNYFMSTGVTIFWDYWKAPNLTYSYLVLVSGTVEPRFNFLNIKDKASFSINFPLSAGIGVGGAGFGDLEFPVLIHYNLGYHSTFNNINHFGFSIGAGLQKNIYPLRPTDKYATQSWIDYVAAINIKCDQRFMNTLGIMTGFRNGFSFKISYSIILFYDNRKYGMPE